MNTINQLGHESSSDCDGPHDQVYYPGPGIVITSGCIHTAASSLRLADVTHYRADRGPADIAVLAGGAVALVVLLAWALAVAYGATPVRLAAGAATVAVVVLLAVAARICRARRAYRLWASYRGSVVLLLATRDRHQYQGVVRAVRRAWQDKRYAGYPS